VSEFSRVVWSMDFPAESQNITVYCFTSTHIWPDLAGITSSSSSSPVRHVYPLGLHCFHFTPLPVAVLQAMPEWESPPSSSDSQTSASWPTQTQPSVCFLSVSFPFADTSAHKAWRRVWLKAHNDSRGGQGRETAVCVSHSSSCITPTPLRVNRSHIIILTHPSSRLGYRGDRILPFHHAFILPRCSRLSACL